MKLKILIIALMLSNTALYAGQAGKGGYFHQTETVSRYVEIVKHFLAAHISGIEPLDFESLRKNSTEKPVDQSQLAKIIKTVKQAPLKTTTKLNADGFPSLLELDYSLEKKEVYLLKPFFEQELYNKTEYSNEIFISMSQKFIHEASHIFGLGVTDDNESKNFASLIINYLIKKQKERSIHGLSFGLGECGKVGTPEERIELCFPIVRRIVPENLKHTDIFEVRKIAIGMSQNFWGDTFLAYLSNSEDRSFTYMSSQELNISWDNSSKAKKMCKNLKPNLQIINREEAEREAISLESPVLFIDNDGEIRSIDATGKTESLGFFNQDIVGFAFCK